MRGRFDTLFGRLFGVLLVAIILAHLLAFAWFHYYSPPPPPPAFSEDFGGQRPAPDPRFENGHRGRGSAGRWCR
jgi:hypothetical protein